MEEIVFLSEHSRANIITQNVYSEIGQRKILKEEKG